MSDRFHSVQVKGKVISQKTELCGNLNYTDKKVSTVSPLGSISYIEFYSDQDGVQGAGFK